MSYEEEYEGEESLEVYDDSTEEIDMSELEDDIKNASEKGFEIGYEMDEIESLEGKGGKETLTKNEEKKEQVEDYGAGESKEEDFM